MNRGTAMICLALSALPGTAAPGDRLLPASDPAGYLARLLINESAFPGERGYVSEADTRAAMRAVVLVIDARIHQIPPGYTRLEIAETESVDLLDVITAGGLSGQVEGFYRDRNGRPALARRVSARIDQLQRIAGRGEPDRFARLLAYAQSVASAYFDGIKPSPDLYAQITRIEHKGVTGRAYGWMTDQDYYHPGGDFVRIPDTLGGRLAGNRFFTLTKRAAAPVAQPPAAQPLVSTESQEPKL